MTQTVRPVRPSPVQLNGSGAGSKRVRSQSRGRVVVAVVGLVVLAVSWAAFEALVPKTAHARVLLVATRSIRAGQVVGSGDVRAVSVASSQFAGVPATERAEVVGHMAGLDIGSGQLLVAADLGGAPGPGVGESVVGMALAAGRLPAGLAPGDTVDVVDTPGASSQGGASAPGAVVGAELTSGRVLSVGPSADGTTTLVSVVVPTSAADSVAVASAAAAVSLIWVPR